MPRAEAHAWWDDVQHLKPGAASPTMQLVRDNAGDAERDGASAPRRVAAAGPAAEPRLSRAHAADFAEAFDIDGAFGAPRRRFARPDAPAAAHEADEVSGDGHVIVLERSPEQVVDEHDAVDLEVVPDVDPGESRRVVRITGRPEAAIAPRRLREIEPRRRSRTSVVDRAASRPDRIALYAVLLGLFLVVLAAASSSAHP